VICLPGGTGGASSSAPTLGTGRGVSLAAPTRGLFLANFPQRKALAPSKGFNGEKRRAQGESRSCRKSPPVRRKSDRRQSLPEPRMVPAVGRCSKRGVDGEGGYSVEKSAESWRAAQELVERGLQKKAVLEGQLRISQKGGLGRGLETGSKGLWGTSECRVRSS